MLSPNVWLPVQGVAVGGLGVRPSGCWVGPGGCPLAPAPTPHPPARTAVDAVPPAPQEAAVGGTCAGVVTQGGAHVGEGLLVVAGLVHAPLRWTRHGSRVSGPQPPLPAPRSPPWPAGPAHLVEGPGVHGGVAALEHGAVPHQHRAVGLCTHLCGDGGGVGVSRAWPGPHAHPQASQGPALTVELAHGAGVYLALQRGWAVPCPPRVHEERGGALHDARAGHEVIRRVPVEGATEPYIGQAVRGPACTPAPPCTPKPLSSRHHAWDTRLSLAPPRASLRS